MPNVSKTGDEVMKQASKYLRFIYRPLDYVPATQVLVDPVPRKWQPMPISEPIDEQVPESVVLQSVQKIAATRRGYSSPKIQKYKG